MSLEEKDVIFELVKMIKRDFGLDYSSYSPERFYSCLGVVLERELGEDEY